MARKMFRGFVVAYKSISVTVVDVVRVGSFINCVKPMDLKNLFQLFGFEAWFLRQIITVEVPVDNNLFSVSRSIVQAVVKAIHII